MTTAQLQLNSELFAALQVISEDENLMKKAVKALKRIVAKKQTAETTEEQMSTMTLAEIIREGDKEIAEGNLKPIAIDDLWK